MRILITGASGFIGGRFARFALEQGLHVRVSGRRGDALEALVKRGAQSLPGNLDDAEFARRLCQGVDAVVHCAGSWSHWGRYQDLYQRNVVLTENIVEGCLKEHVRRLVHVSCADIYGPATHRAALREDGLPRRWRNTPARTRHLAELKVSGAQEFGLETLILRPQWVLGAGDNGLLPRLLELHRRNRLTLAGDGLNTVDMTSVQNLNEALLAALFADDDALGHVYNLSNGHPLPLWDVVNYTLRQLGHTNLTHYRSTAQLQARAALAEAWCRIRPGRPEPRLTCAQVSALGQTLSLDISRARQHLDYRPRVTVWTALDEFSAWWRQLPRH